MSRARLRMPFVLALAGGAGALALTCGGRFSPGYFDNDGGFHAPDGAFLFSPGSSCKDYDASGLADTEGEWTGSAFSSIACDADSFCAKALPAGLSFSNGGPPHDPFYLVACQSNVCRASIGDNVACSGADDDGNNYCRQFYQQFVVASGAHALASCKRCRDVQPGQNDVCSGEYICVPDCCVDVYNLPYRAGFCVQRGQAAPTCEEYPCQP